MGKSLEDMGTGEKFLNRTAMACAVRWRIDKWDLIKLQSFCKAKDAFNMTKRPQTDWERIFTYPKSVRGLISNTYKELEKVDSRKSTNPIKKWGSGLNKEFSAFRSTRASGYLASGVAWHPQGPTQDSTRDPKTSSEWNTSARCLVQTPDIWVPALQEESLAAENTLPTETKESATLQACL